MSATALVLANLVIVLLALLRAWGFYELILVYWCEALVVGAYTIARMVAVGLDGEPLGKWVAVEGALNRLFVLALALGLFLVKFGGFALGLGLLVALVPAFLSSDPDAKGMQVLRALDAVGPGVAVAVAALALSHGISFVMNFLRRGEFRRTNLLVLLFLPYVRMSLVMVTLAAGIVAAALLPSFAASAVFGIVVALVKTGADLVMHRLEHAVVSEGGDAPR